MYHMHPIIKIIIMEECTLTKPRVMFIYKHKPDMVKPKPLPSQHVLFYIKHYHIELSDSITIFSNLVLIS